MLGRALHLTGSNGPQRARARKRRLRSRWRTTRPRGAAVARPIAGRVAGNGAGRRVSVGGAGARAGRRRRRVARTRAGGLRATSPSFVEIPRRSRGTRPASDASETAAAFGWTRPISPGRGRPLPVRDERQLPRALRRVAANLHRDPRRSGASRCSQLDGGRGGTHRQHRHPPRPPAGGPRRGGPRGGVLRPHARGPTVRPDRARRGSALARSPRPRRSATGLGRGGRAAQSWFAKLWIAHVRGLGLLWDGDERASEVLLEAERVSDRPESAIPTTSTGLGTRSPPISSPDATPTPSGWSSGSTSAPTPSRFAGRVSPRCWAGLASPSAPVTTMPPRPAFRAAPEILDGVDLPLQRVEGLLALRRLPAPARALGRLPRAPPRGGAAGRGVRRPPARRGGGRASCGSPEVAAVTPCGPRSAHRGRAARRAGGRRRAHQRRDRPPPPPLREHGRDPPEARLREARDPLPAPACRTRPRRRRARDRLAITGNPGCRDGPGGGRFGDGFQRRRFFPG